MIHQEYQLKIAFTKECDEMGELWDGNEYGRYASPRLSKYNSLRSLKYAFGEIRESLKYEVRNMNHHKPFGVISKDESLRSLGGSRKSQWSVGSRSW